MVQHLLLIMVAPPLLVFGRPVTLLLHATRNPWHTRIKRMIRSRLLSGLTHPIVAFALYAAVVGGTHLTPLMTLVLRNSAVHDAEHALYLAVGYLYFLPVIGSEPIRWRLPLFGRYLLLLGTMPVDTAVGVALMLAPHRLFPGYAVADLHRGGLVMFAGSDLIMAALGIGLAIAFVRAGERPHGDLDAYNAYLAALGTANPEKARGLRPEALLGAQIYPRLVCRSWYEVTEYRVMQPVRRSRDGPCV
jgi:putative copper resistance protein D